MQSAQRVASFASSIYDNEPAIFQRLISDFTVDGELLYAGSLLRYAAKNHGNQVALICNGRTITYHELYFRSILFGKKLAGHINP